MTCGASTLAFGFVTPLFAAAGVGLASIPIIIHLLNRRRHKTVPWAAMRFLLAAVKKNRRRMRFEQWLLLAVRCGVLSLFALALARPLGCDQSTIASLAAQRSGLHVLIIDNSYSMAYESNRPDAKTNLDAAKLLARKLIGRMKAGESVAILTAARPAAAVVAEPTYDLSAATAAIERIRQSYGGTDLPGALRAAIDIGNRHTAAVQRDLLLLTDASRGAFEGVQAAELPELAKEAARSFTIAHFTIASPSAANQTVMAVNTTGRLVRTTFDNAFTCEVLGFGAVPSMPLQWSVDQQPLPGTVAVTPTVNSPPITQPQIHFKTGGYHVISAALLGDDRLKADDTRWRVVDVVAQMKVLIVEGQRGVGTLAGSGSFLSLALSPPMEGQTNSNQSASYVQPELISDLEFGTKPLTDYRAVVLAGVGQVGEQQAEQLKAFVQNGGALLLFMGEAVSSQNYNATLLPRGLLPGPLVQRVSAVDNKPHLFDFNPSGTLHPLLNVFRNQEKSGLDTAPVFTYWKVDPNRPGAERVLNYRPDAESNGDPAITAHSLGMGRIVFVSTTANWDWTFLPAKPAYVALVHEMLGGSVTATDGWLNKSVGDRLALPPSVQLKGLPQLRDPQQTPVIMEPADGGTYRSATLELPGIYTLDTGGSRFPVAVNVTPDEADVRPLDSAALLHALGDVPLATYDDQPPAETTAIAGNDYGLGTLWLVLIGLAVECVLALRFGHARS